MAASAKSLSSLLAQTSIDDHDEILRASNADLKKSKNNIDAHHVKAVALLHLDRYDDAAKVFEDVPQLQEKARFEYAYALYKSGDAAKAVEVAAKDDSSRAMRHVLGQAVCVQVVKYLQPLMKWTPRTINIAQTIPDLQVSELAPGNQAEVRRWLQFQNEDD